MEKEETETLASEVEDMSGRDLPPTPKTPELPSLAHSICPQEETGICSHGLLVLADVTLDPDTANAFLILAGDQRGVGRGHEWISLPNNPERFETEPCVLGSQGFTAGRHCWEVEVADGGDWWAVGVAQDSVRRKGILSFSPQEGIWAVGQWFGQYHAFTDPDWTPLHLACLPRAIQVCLDFTDRQVAFVDAENKAPIFVFCLPSCPGGSLRPWFWVGMDSWLKLCF